MLMLSVDEAEEVPTRASVSSWGEAHYLRPALYCQSVGMKTDSFHTEIFGVSSVSPWIQIRTGSRSFVEVVLAGTETLRLRHSNSSCFTSSWSLSNISGIRKRWPASTLFCGHCGLCFCKCELLSVSVALNWSELRAIGNTYPKREQSSFSPCQSSTSTALANRWNIFPYLIPR